MIPTRGLGMLAIRSVAPRRVSALSFHTSALLLRARPALLRGRARAQSEGILRPKPHYGRTPKRYVMVKPAKRYTPVEVQAILISELNQWTTLVPTMLHIKALGISEEQAQEWLAKFPSAVRDEIVALDPKQPQAGDAQWNLERIADNMAEDKKFGLQSAFMTRFLQFAISRLESSSLADASSRRLLASLLAIREATDLRNKIEWYPLARSMRRKVIMHVGPTNSGKTYNALQALAGAPSGVYAGPLRLLAHEVWQRINKGSITPKPPSPNEPQQPDKDEGIVDLDDATPVSVTTELSLNSPTIVKSITSTPSPPRAYQGRPCNLLTGEEQRIVSPTATTIACTVEMIPKHLIWDVGIIDEIQMLADSTRGGAWTSAVLGLAARELHLCGEDTVVDLVRALCALTGDELIVNRYERLTPLEVESKSLRNNLKNVQPGDCVVTFSRAEIFETKRKIEEATGLRCAVVYGRLPPEIRSEQAQLFNTEESGYDVIVASDSVGMGLNLQRVVFMRTEKHRGHEAIPLPIPLIKQIGGRAGRFGVHKSKSQHHEITKSSMTDIAASQPPGLVSALGEASLQKVREAMSTPNPTVTQARVDISNPNIEPLARALPPGTGITELLDTMRHLAILPPTMRLCIPDTGASRNIGISPPRIITSDSPAEPALPRTEDVSTAIDSITRSLPISERLVFALAPVRWRDPFSKAAAFAYFRAYERQMHVGVQDDLKGLELLEALEEVRGYMKRMSKSRIISGKSKTPEWPLTVRMSQEALAELEEVTLQRLESLHATLVVYMWLSYRLPLGFYQSHEAEQLKAEVERGIEWCLEQIKTGRTRRQPFKYSGSVVERLTAERKPEAKIQYLTRDAIEQWRSQGSTPAVWEQLVKNKPRQATG